MNPGKMSVQRASLLLASMLVGSSLLGAADDATTTAVSSNSTTTSPYAQSQDEEIAQLKAALAEQQKQLQSLQQTLQSQQQLIEKSPARSSPARPLRLAAHQSRQRCQPYSGPPGSGRGCRRHCRFRSRSPAPRPQAQPAVAAIPAKPDPTETPSRLYLRLGSVCIIPIGFMDLTPFWRDKNAGSSMGSNFGSVPYNNTANGNLSEMPFQHPELAARFPRRRRLERRALHRL